jgi:uncharacterized protein YndB with AHSA1/START domain
VRSIADLSEGVVRAVIDIDGEPDDVFEALTDPAQLASWWGGDQYRTCDWVMELRPGGAWSARALGKDGENRVHGEVLAVERPSRLVVTWHASWDGDARTVIHYGLERTPGGGTRVTVVHEGFGGRPGSCQGHAVGWDLVLGWLGAHVAAAPASRET